MKKVLFIIAIMLAFSFQKPELREGWNDGYVHGYCYEQEFCIKPIVPIMPIPRIQDTSYTAMYNRGFVEGLRKYKE